MACPSIITGEEFLERTLAHVDCQAQLIGSYGYQALGQPGSTASLLVTGLLTLFIAFFGIRLLFGPAPAARDVVFDVLKIGIVLTLAFSWPAFRTVVYDVTLKGPAEIASVIQAGSGNGSASGFAERLQQADNDMVRLTALGAGRNTGAIIDESSPQAGFEGAALEDDAAFGSARLLYLASVIGTIALLRIAAGLLLAVAPLVAGLYFFAQSRGMFAGWLKGLVFTFAGSLGATIVLSVELAILQPWLADALNVRALGYATPSAPIELFALTLAFAIVQLVMLWLLAKVTFHRGWLTLPDIPRINVPAQERPQVFAAAGNAPPVEILRAERISNTLESSLRRERTMASEQLLRGPQATPTGALAGAAAPGTIDGPARLGSSYRRSSTRGSRSAQRRDSSP